MSSQNVQVPAERGELFIEHALAMFREMRDVATEIPNREVLNQAKPFATSQGRELMRKGLEKACCRISVEDAWTSQTNWCALPLPVWTHERLRARLART
jgi:hypothetical protein